MKGNLLTLLFLVISLLLLPVVQASGSPAHDHGTISPFDQQQYGHKLYCELNKHHLLRAFCPHSFAEKNQEKHVIASDCGGKTPETLPTFGSDNTSMFSSGIVHFNFDLAPASRKRSCPFCSFGFFLSDQIDHPPQTV